MVSPLRKPEHKYTHLCLLFAQGSEECTTMQWYLILASLFLHPILSHSCTELHLSLLPPDSGAQENPIMQARKVRIVLHYTLKGSGTMQSVLIATYGSANGNASQSPVYITILLKSGKATGVASGVTWELLQIVEFIGCFCKHQADICFLSYESFS